MLLVLNLSDVLLVLKHTRVLARTRAMKQKETARRRADNAADNDTVPSFEHFVTCYKMTR